MRWTRLLLVFGCFRLIASYNLLLSTSGISANMLPPPLPAGKMSDVRALRKRQQLNNLVVMVTELARPGYTIVDFCSGTVRMLIIQHACVVLLTAEPICRLACTDNVELLIINVALSQGHVGIVLAHALPDCQVECVLMLTMAPKAVLQNLFL